MKLRHLIRDDPHVRGYASAIMTAQEIFDDLYEPHIDVVVPVSPKAQRMWIAQEGRFEKIAKGIETGVNDTVKSLCRAALLMATTDDEYKREDHLSMLQALEGAGLGLTSDDTTALDGKADKTVSLDDYYGLGEVALAEEEEAKAWHLSLT